MSALDLLPLYVRENIRSGDGRTREDLRAIPAAEKAGWVVVFRDNHWHNSAEFVHGPLHVWYASKGWRSAVVRGGRFADREWHTSLADALARKD